MTDTFERVGSNLGVDFANTTQAGTRTGGRIACFEDVLAFIASTEALPTARLRQYRQRARERPAERSAAYARALALREAIHDALEAIDHKRRVPADAVATINGVLELERGCERLVSGRGGLALTFESDRDELDNVLVPIAHAAARVLGGDASLLRKCANPACDRYFYDDSRTKRRRWCSMAVCGNRAKVAAFAARQTRRTARS